MLTNTSKSLLCDNKCSNRATNAHKSKCLHTSLKTCSYSSEIVHTYHYTHYYKHFDFTNINAVIMQILSYYYKRLQD